MANKNCLARGIEWNEEPEGIAQLTEPCVVSFGYWNFKIVEKNYKKWQAVLQHITINFKVHHTVILILTVGLGLDSMLDDKILVLVLRNFSLWSWSRDLVTKVLVLVSKPGDQGLGLGLKFFQRSW